MLSDPLSIYCQIPLRIWVIKWLLKMGFTSPNVNDLKVKQLL